VDGKSKVQSFPCVVFSVVSHSSYRFVLEPNSSILRLRVHYHCLPLRLNLSCISTYGSRWLIIMM
jgi:hypothetical protein